MIRVFESPDLALRIASQFFERVSFRHPKALRACPLLGLTRITRAIYRPLLDGYLVVYDEMQPPRFECRWCRDGLVDGWIFYMKPFDLPWHRLHMNAQAAPWSHGLCQRVAWRTNDHLRALEQEIETRFMLTWLQMVELDLFITLDSFCDCYVAPMARILWNGSVAAPSV